MKIDKRELLAIPNILSYIRILLLPIFCVVYLSAETPKDYYMAGGIVIASGLTDLLDGKIARHYDAITEFGKFIDPLADKLTLGAIALCLIPQYKYMIYLALMILLKEALMMIMGIVHLRHGRKLGGAKMISKICTTTLFAALGLLILWHHFPVTVVNSLIAFEIFMVTITIITYMIEFHKMKQTWED